MSKKYSDKNRTAVIVLNWNGKEDTIRCIESLIKQTEIHTLIVVDNGSVDGLADHVRHHYREAVLLVNETNLGFAGGENTGMRYAIENNFRYIGLINNDAYADPEWLEELVKDAEGNPEVGLVTSLIMRTNGRIDSTGDQYTLWGLAYPRGRDEEPSDKYATAESVFSGSGGASLYRVEMLKEIGCFDEDFFAYYEDVDLSFRAQLAGWKVLYNPKAVVHHKVGASSGKIPGFTTYQTVKNLPWLFWKNVPIGLMPKILPRFYLAYISLVVSSLAKGKIPPVTKGLLVSAILLPKKLIQRKKIQRTKKVTTEYIDSIITHDLPPNATKLRKLRKWLNIHT